MNAGEVIMFRKINIRGVMKMDSFCFFTEKETALGQYTKKNKKPTKCWSCTSKQMEWPE